MKRAFAAALTFAILGCASTKNANIILPELQLAELTSLTEMGQPSGRIDLQFALRIANKSGEPITLRRIEMSSIGSGAYELLRDTYYFKQTVEPNQSVDVPFWAKAVARGARSLRANEPVTIRGVAYFESPAGPFQKVVTRYISQYE
ncbi:MAG TPA: hypothetical protein VF698_06795 [Thermoanaerobaculia bacterium]|jgi:hypothetical protein